MSDTNEIDNNVLKAWRMASADLGLSIQSPFTLTMPTGKQITYGLLIKDFGSDLGIIIYTTFDRDDVDDEPWKYGYYSSALNPEHYSKYDRKYFIEALTDWGYFGDIKSKPDWYKGHLNSQNKEF